MVSEGPILRPQAKERWWPVPLERVPLTVQICALPRDPGLGRGAGCSLCSQRPGGIQTRASPCRYLCCETQMELREWFATFLFVQVPDAEHRGGAWAGGGVPRRHSL